MQFTPASLNSIANDVGLDSDAFSECLSSRTHQADVENARQTAAKLGVNSTPTFFINNRLVKGNQPYQQFQAIINQEIAAAQ